MAPNKLNWTKSAQRNGPQTCIKDIQYMTYQGCSALSGIA